jgi:hypothetical protein
MAFNNKSDRSRKAMLAVDPRRHIFGLPPLSLALKLALSLLLVLSTQALAQSPESAAAIDGIAEIDQPETISSTSNPPIKTEEAVALALHNSRLLQSLETKLEIKTHLSRSPSRLDNPELRVRNLSTRSVDERFNDLEIGLRWRPPTLGKAAEDRQRSQVSLWEQKVEVQRSRNWLASRVRRACADIRLHHQRAGLAAARVNNETQRIIQIKAMVDLGRRSVVYYTKAKMTETQTKNERNRHLRALHNEERRLQRLTGTTAPLDIIPEKLPEIDLDQDKLLAIAYAHRPEMSLVRAHQQLATAQQQRQHRQGWPSLSFVEIAHHREQGGGDWQELMLGIELPLFDRNSGRSAAAELGIARKEAQALALNERIEDEVSEAFAAYTEARLAWRLADNDGQHLIEEATGVIAQAKAHGTIPAEEVLELERTIIDTRELIARRHRELAHAIYSLWYALGIEQPQQAASQPEE